MTVVVEFTDHQARRIEAFAELIEGTPEDAIRLATERAMSFLGIFGSPAADQAAERTMADPPKPNRRKPTK
jgi:hypothetical protein